MTTENRDWLTEGAVVAVISTARTSGNKSIGMDTVEAVGPKFIKTAKGHKFDMATLKAPVISRDMYLWRIADPESPETKLGLAVQAREKMLSSVHMHQRRVDRNPLNTDLIGALITALTKYRELVVAAESLTDMAKASS